MHFGKITFDVDERGEVGLLTRNIRLQASADAEQSFYGGHVMAMGTSKMFVEGVEFNRMGQNLTLARYPIHWHLIGDAKGQYIRNAAIHDTYNRCVTVHGTNNLQVENNVTYNTVGHCFFLEDGIETRQPVHPQPGDPDQVSYVQALRPDQPRPVRIDDDPASTSRRPARNPRTS